MKRSKTNSRRIKRLERKTASGSTIVNAFLGSSSGSGGVSSFLELTDTPTSYTGESLKAVRVNVGETALEFYTPSSGGLTGSGTTNEIAYFTGATSLASLTTATYPSLTELSHVKGVTSSIQTQFTGKLNTGLAWLLGSGGTLTGNNEIIGTGYTLIGTWNALGTTQTNGYGLWLRNTTAAAAGAQQISPSIVLEGQGWKTTAAAASQSVKWSIDALPVEGSANPTGTLRFRVSINNAAYTLPFTFSSAGNLALSSISGLGGATALGFGAGQSLGSNSSQLQIACLGGTAPVCSAYFYPTSNLSSTSTEQSLFGVGIGTSGGTQAVFAPTSGTAKFNNMNMRPIINQTGGANGDIRLLNMEPAYTAVGGSLYAWRYVPAVTSITGQHFASYHSAGFVAWDSVLSPAQITSNQNDYAPNGWNNSSSAPYGASILRLSTDASRDLTGLSGGTSGRLVIISNVGAFDLVIKDENAGSTSANRFALNNDITLFPEESLMFWYDGTSSRWRPCIKHKTGSTAYTPTNVTTDRSYDANATTLDELADVVGTLIADLQTLKILS